MEDDRRGSRNSSEFGEIKRGLSRNKAFRNAEDLKRKYGIDVQQLRRGLAMEAIQSKPVEPYLHSLTHGGKEAVKAQGLMPKNLRNAQIKQESFASTNSNTDVFVGGPEVMKGFFNLGLLESRKEFVHVIGQRHDFMPDHDYQEYVGGKIKVNDSVMYDGIIPPLRDAQPGDTGPKSFMLPMTPRTRRGASRYMADKEGYEDLAVAEIKRKFRARFDDEDF